MRIRDKELWLAQQAEIQSRPDQEMGEVFLSFLESWCDRAESLLNGLHGSYDDPPLLSPIEALRRALEPTQEALGHLPIGWLGQLLLYIEAHWESGVGLFDAMTPIEKHFVAEVAFVVQEDLQQQAQEVPSGPPS